MVDVRPMFLSYAGAADPGVLALSRRLWIYSVVVGVLVVLASLAIFLGGWDDARFNRSVYGPSPRMVAGWTIHLIEAALSFVAGVYLLLAARALRRHPLAGLRHHLIYAIAKLLLALVAAVGGFVLMGQGDAAMVDDRLYGVLVFIQFAISAAYPLLILFFLRRLSARPTW